MPAAPSASVAVDRRATSGRGLVASPDGAAWRPTGSAPGPGDAGTSTGCCRGARGRGRTRCCGASASTPPSWRRCPRGGMSSVHYARARAPRGDGRPPVRARGHHNNASAVLAVGGRGGTGFVPCGRRSLVERDQPVTLACPRIATRPRPSRARDHRWRRCCTSSASSTRTPRGSPTPFPTRCSCR